MSRGEQRKRHSVALTETFTETQVFFLRPNPLTESLRGTPWHSSVALSGHQWHSLALTEALHGTPWHSSVFHSLHSLPQSSTVFLTSASQNVHAHAR